MARQRNPRRIAVNFLRDFKRDVGRLVNRWDVTGKVYLEPSEREHPSRYFRARQDHEYPENNPQAWAQLAEDAEELARSAMALSRFARRQRADLMETAGQR